MSNSLLLAAGLSFVTFAPIVCADWTQFRGPGGDGHSDAQNLPVEWSEDRNVAWKVAVSGKGWSSPVIADGQIYVTTGVSEADGDDAPQSLRVVCLAAATGETVWEREVFRQTEPDVQIHKKNSHASPTPIIEDGHLFVHFGPHGTACLKTNGDVVWKNTDLKYAPQHGNGGCPAIYDNTLIICCDGTDRQFVTGLNKSTGTEIWRSSRELNPSRGFSFCTPTIVTVDGIAQAVCPGSGGAMAYDPLTGRQIWQITYGEGYSVVPRPVAAHGLVYVCSGFGDGQLFAVDPTGHNDITETHVRWKTKKGVPKSPSVLVVDRELYMVDDKGIASCLDAVSGQLHWQQRLPGKYSASPAFADGHIYFQNETGQTTVIAPGTEYSEVATNQLGDGKTQTLASFAFIDEAIIYRSETHLYRIQNQ